MPHSGLSKTHLVLFCLVLVFNLQAARAAVDGVGLATELRELVVDGNVLLAAMQRTTLTAADMAGELASVEADTRTYRTRIITLHSMLVATDGTISVTGGQLASLQSLAAVSAALAEANRSIASQIRGLAPVVSATTLDSSLATVLRLSDDIGLMANRILEMADKILVMADNIGLMADRIIATQVIQSNNLALVLEANLQTQTNAITLVQLFLGSSSTSCCSVW